MTARNDTDDSIKVLIIESERGWGSKVDEVKYFDTKGAALKFIVEFNSVNDLDEVPDWYMYAELAEEREVYSR